LTSIAQAAGLVVTVVLDLTLIPPLGIVGAATASTFAYLTTTCVLVVCFRKAKEASRGRHAQGSPTPPPTPPTARTRRTAEAPP
jgi:Na+-driven multidrug efflux pump